MQLIHARFVLPICEPAIERGTVGVEDGTIRYVGPRDGAPPGASEIRDLGEALLMPGLVNAHTHLELTAMRGFLEDLEFRRWILRLTGARRAVMNRDVLLDSARLGIREGLAAGVTTYADTCASDVVLDAMLEYGVRGIAYREVFGPDPAACSDSMSGLREAVASMRLRETELVRVGVSPHAPYTVSDELFLAAVRYQEEAGLPMAIHIAESESEMRLVVNGDGPFADGLRARGIAVGARARSCIQLLADLGVLRARPLLIHCVRVDGTDIAAIATAGCAVAHCPASNAKLGHGVAPLLEFLDAGVDVGLGSDSMASNNRMDILDEARVAVLLQRARLGSYQSLTARDALTLATMGGASALGLAHRIGSLEVGKAADLAAFPIGTRGPVHDPEAAAVFALGGAQASFVMVAGRPLIVNHRCAVDDDGLSDRVQGSAELLREWLSEGGEIALPDTVPFLGPRSVR